MKKKVTAAQWVIIVLGVGLIVSLAWNCRLYTQLYGPLPPLKGTYCTDASRPRGVYLIFDGESRFCRYNQEEGVLDDGTCEDIGEKPGLPVPGGPDLLRPEEPGGRVSF